MITIIWQCDASTAWEKDWIEHIFRNIPHNTVSDYDQSLIIDQCFIVYNRTVDNDQYIKNLHARRINFSLIHLSDEWEQDSTENYKLANVVLRNYYKDLGPNVINFPLGCMKTFPYDTRPNTISDRPYVWSFTGCVNKTSRPEMAKHMSTVPNGKSYFNWGSFEEHSLSPIELSELYNKTIFVPCPRGNYNIDSLRVCEALQAGAIPIVERSDYWANLYGKDHPLIEIDSWEDAPGVIDKLLNHHLLEYKRTTTYNWWVTHCDKLSTKLKKITENKMTKNIEHFYTTIPGWFDFQNHYSRMVNQAQNGAHFVEVGTWKGTSAAFMAVEIVNSQKQIRFDCVDTWLGDGGEAQIHDPDIQSGTLYEAFLKYMMPVEGYYNPIKNTSVEAAKLYADESLDFVFIDAAHDYTNVHADITAWLPKVKMGGWMGGHDYPYSEGIRQACSELLPGHSADYPGQGASWMYYKSIKI